MSRSPAPARRGAADRRTLPGRHEPRAASPASRIVLPPNDTNREPPPAWPPAATGRPATARAKRPHGDARPTAAPGLSHHHSRAARRALRRVAVVVVVVRGGWSARTPAAASNTGADSRHVRTHARRCCSRGGGQTGRSRPAAFTFDASAAGPGDPRLPVGLGYLLGPGGRARRLAGCARRARPPGLRFLGSAARGSDRPRRGPGGRRRGGRPRAGAQPARRRASPPTLASSAPALTHGGERSPQLTSRGRATRRGAGAPHRESCRSRAPDRPTWCPVRGRRRAPRGGP